VAYSPYPPRYQPPWRPPPQGNGFGVTALVLGLVGLVLFSWFPFLNIFTGGLLGLLAIIFGIVGVGKSGSRGGAGLGTGGTGLVLGIVTILIVISVNVWAFNFLDETADTVYEEQKAACSSDGLYTEQECEDIWG
jgi:hypothetical protein